jgi:hypothetical protein
MWNKLCAEISQIFDMVRLGLKKLKDMEVREEN